jgi:hypothetical protein
VCEWGAVYQRVLPGDGDHLHRRMSVRRMNDVLFGNWVLAFAPLVGVKRTVEMCVGVVCDCKLLTFTREPHRNIGLGGLMGRLLG